MAHSADEFSTKNLKDLVTKRSSIKGQITKFKNYLERVTNQEHLSSIEVTELTLKLTKFEGLVSKFDDIQTQIEITNSDNIDLEIEERSRIDEDMIVTIATAKTFLEDLNHEHQLQRRESMVVNNSQPNTSHQPELEQLTGELPKSPIDRTQLTIPSNINLADPTFDQPGPIDILIGADCFWDVIGDERKSLGPNKPKLHSSKFGWLIAGPINNTKVDIIHSNHAIVTSMHENTNINEMLTRFWQLEDIPSKLSPKDSECEKHFKENTVRLDTGRFCVKLPLKDNADCLGNSYNLAKKRLLNLEKRFRKNPDLKSQYSKFINEYAELGHLTKTDYQGYPNSPHYYLCHHAVFKENSESSQIRVVFDGSAPSTSGFSVNDLMRVGPNVQDSLFSILIRARQYKYLLTGDIEKMYRQVEVNSDDRDLQLILWREDESKPIHTLRLNTLTYGTASASYLSTRCLRQVGEDCDDPRIGTIIKGDFYVDDLITGANDETELRSIRKAISEALESYCFKLRKFKSNSLSVIDDLNVDNQHNLTLSESSSTLGLGHFLIGRALVALPSPDLEDYNENRLRRYARLEQIRQHFWRRWQREYISELQIRKKWKTDKAKLKIGDLVILQEDHSPPLYWRLGRVTQLFPGPDGISRVAEVNTARGLVRRALVRLCPLPAAEDEEEEEES
ncbi:unnamed protein product [Plutella xylostella]|uniref:(diamondback moth) hypothetical protein n=1 Tax=Plutella xylostella TaxID=51655 RepID=A0A8S4ER12_PLUXY|nr:unnamed protein product [Plutella xylostella]